MHAVIYMLLMMLCLNPPSPSQPGVRAASLETLNAWQNELTISPMIEQELISNALSTESPNLRTEVYVVCMVHALYVRVAYLF